MAYSRQKTAACPVLGDPGVVSAYLPITTDPSDVPIKVPWNYCKLVYAYTVYTETEASGTMVQPAAIDLELLDSDGNKTDVMTIALLSNVAVGTVTEATFVDESSCGNLGNTDSINCEITGNAGETTFGGVTIYLYFEPDTF